MPDLASTPGDLWKVLAKRWRKQSSGRSPDSLTVEERRASLRARAAYWVATVPGATSGPQPQGCNRCGMSTHSWCEGCYRRAGHGPNPFLPICRVCDSDHLVCDECITAAVTWEDGHSAYEAVQGAEDEQTVEITIDPSQPPVRISLSELAASTGASEQQVRDEIIRALGVSPAPDA